MTDTAPTTLDELRTRLPLLLGRDEQRLGRRLDSLARQRKGSSDELARVIAAVGEAEAKVARRAALVPTVTYPPELPITERVEELRALINDHQVIIVAGETGSGKSTQLPKICIEAGRGRRGLIGHTQPRRIAARSVAERVAEELGTTIGAAVGFTVRFSDHVGDDTLVKVMTDGILLAETRRDRELLAYDTIIIDEAHERSLNIDFLLGYIRQLLPRRPDLKVIITSATIDTEKFAAHFASDDGPAPILEVSGRSYPVEVRYESFGEEPGDERDQTQAIADAVDELALEGPGDVLVFLSGEREIHDTADALRRSASPDTEILPLYARLTSAEQRRIFQPHRGRRIVLSTNVAETSLTVPGVRYVVDTGTARISRYSRRLKVQRLPIEDVSQASANQRAGRCGRVAPGICIRLYSEENFAARPAFTEPEILRTNLASVILQATVLDLGDIAAFPFVDPPDSRAINDGVALLEEIGAFDQDETDVRKRLTPVGRKLAQMPIDPRLGRMVLEAERNDCVREVMVIAAALSIQDPRVRPADHAQAADAKHARFAVEGSDFLAFLRLWDYIREQQKALSKGEFRRMCKADYLNYLRIREWQDINKQLRDVISTLNIRTHTDAAEPDRIHLSLLAGLLSHVGFRATTTEREFTGARNAKFMIAPGSGLARKPPSWVMAAELVETNRLWARVAARIEPAWVERLAVHLIKRTYSDPRWDEKRGAAVATERVTLYGLPIVSARTVDYARVDPVVARELFIHHALVGREWTTRHAFFHGNVRRMEEVRALEDRARRRDVLIGEEALFDMFDARLPVDVVSARHFDQWWKKASRDTPDLLTLTTEDVIDSSNGPIRLEDFPDDWVQGANRFALSYRYEPNRPGDGVTVHIPLPVLNRVRADGFDWQIPGRRHELVESLIRSLPKATRRHLVPISDHADDFLRSHTPEDGPLIELLARRLTGAIRTTSGGYVDIVLRPGDFDLERLPDDVRITFSVEDEHGHPFATAKDLGTLVERFSGQTRTAIADAVTRGADAPAALEQRGLRTWAVGTIPKQIEARTGGHTVVGHPALVDDGDSVSVRIFATAAEQATAMWKGTRRLLALAITVPRKQLERQLSNDARLALAASGMGGVDALIDESLLCTYDQLLRQHGGPRWDEAAFADLRDLVRADTFYAASVVIASAAQAIAAAGSAARKIDGLRAEPLQLSVDDMRRQLRWLVHPGFVTSTGADRLPDVARYVEGIGVRVDKLGGDAVRDRKRMQPIRRLQDEIDDLLLTCPPSRMRELLDVRWLVEELRISVFAQALGTPGPISEQRIVRALDALTEG